MKNRNQQARQLLGCGYEPELPEAMRRYVSAWDHPGRVRDFDEPKVCVGYVCALPEVIEASHAHDFKKDGELTQFCGGQATPQLLNAIVELQNEYSRMDAWAHANPEKK